jgi:hypothetical protein
MTREQMELRITISGFLVAAGLIVQIVSLLWSHPLAFVVFLGAGVPLVAAGALLYLYALVQVTENT